MAANAVIYEVTADVDASIIAELDTWLTQHVHDMLQLPGFLDAKILRPQMQPATIQGGTKIQRVIQYTLENQKDLDLYFQEHAARMRNQATARFGERLRTSRRVLDIQGNELKAIDATDAPITAAKPLSLHCLNCGAPLTGKFCANCGQQSHTYAAPLFSVIEDFFGNHFGFDTKFFHSILPLLFRPGFLSREYSAGRRVRYINPLRLYIFSSIVLFFLAWTIASPQLARFNDSGEGPSKLLPYNQRNIHTDPHLTDKQKKQILNSVQNKETDAGTAATQNDSMSGEMFGKKFTMSKTEFRARLIHDFETYLPKMMFVFLPLVALLLKLFYIRSKRYYMEHLVFTLHNHAFVYTAMIFILLAGVLGKHFIWLATPARYFKDIVGWYIVIYIFLAMLFYYRQSFIKTLIKFLLLGFIYWLVLIITFVLGIVLIFTEVLAI